jgi:uroporphyrinogen-III synthase
MKPMTRIISTRKMNEQDKQQALSHGFLIADQDFLSFDYLSNDPLADAVKNMPQACVFTSQHAVKAVINISNAYQTELKGKDCFCIEGTTKQLALKHGFNVIGEAGNSAALAAVILAKHQDEIVFFSGNLKREELVKILTENHVKVHEHVVYHKSLIPLKIQEHYEGIMFFSPSQIDAFSAANHLPKETPAFCIGSTTGDYLNLKGHENILVAEQKNITSVLNKIYEYYQ